LITRVAVCQLALAVGDVAANRAAARAAVATAAADGADLVVLPELANSGYSFDGPDEARGLAEHVGGPTVAGWTAQAREHGLVIVGGLCELDDSGAVRNSAVLVDATGPRAVYRKAHLWADEKDHFVPGSSPPPVVDSTAGRIGLLICYDAEFPEWVRLPALAGADILAIPTSWPASESPRGERHALVVNVQAAAYANRVFAAVADRSGPERGVGWVGGSVIVGPDGYPLAGPALRDEPALLAADCDLDRARDKTVGPRNDIHADRRLDLYAARPATQRPQVSCSADPPARR
jgi:predicted amidohydrolase